MKGLRFSIGIRAKVIIVFLLFMATTALGGYVIISSLEELRTASAEQQNIVDSIAVIKEVQNQFSDINLLGMDVIVDHYESPTAKVVRREEFAAMQRSYDETAKHKIATLARVGSDVEGQELVASLHAMLLGVHNLIEAIDAGEKSPEKYATFDQKIDSAKVNGVAAVSRLRTEFESRFQKSQQQTQSRYKVLTNTVWLSNAMCIAIVLFVGFPVCSSIRRTIAKIQDQIAAVATIAEDSSNELSDASRSLATYSSQAASAIQESVSSMTEMSAMLSQTSRNAAETADLSREVLAQTKDGITVMADMSSSMKAISASSTRLNEIVRVIDNIATKTNVINDVVFKTQLLAVNASIEAARAGHHGKGFAVVANEVASLAALSGKASTEIKDLLAASGTQVTQIIDGTSESIRDGERTSLRSSEVFEAIAKSMETISDKVEQISTASREQEAGVSQTSTALGQMNQATGATNTLAQRNAKLGGDVMKVSERIHLVDRAMRYLVTGSEADHAKSSATKLSRIDRILFATSQQSASADRSGKLARGQKPPTPLFKRANQLQAGAESAGHNKQRKSA